MEWKSRCFDITEPYIYLLIFNNSTGHDFRKIASSLNQIIPQMRKHWYPFWWRDCRHDLVTQKRRSCTCPFASWRCNSGHWKRSLWSRTCPVNKHCQLSFITSRWTYSIDGAFIWFREIRTSFEQRVQSFLVGRFHEFAYFFSLHRQVGAFPEFFFPFSVTEYLNRDLGGKLAELWKFQLKKSTYMPFIIDRHK